MVLTTAGVASIIFASGFVMQVLTAAVQSMNTPRKDYGAYLFFWKFLRQTMNIADETFEKRFNMAMPRVNETAIQKVTTPNSVTETAVTKTTTSPTLAGR